MYEIGQKIWKWGNEIKITSEPYEKIGGWWQDGVVIETGKIVTVPTPDQEAKNVQAQKDAWQKQQSDFRKLAK